MLCVAALCTAMLSGCGKKEQQIEEKEPLVIGYTVYSPFMDHNESREAVGIDAELVREVCERIGREPEFVLINWEEKKEFLEQGRVDCLLSGFSITEEGKGTYLWSEPYLRSKQVVIVPADSTIERLSDLEGKTVAALSGGKSEELLLNQAEYPEIPLVKELYSFESLEEVCAALENGYCDATCGKAAAWSYLLQDEFPNYRFLDEALAYSQIGIAFSTNGDPELIEEVNRALREMKADGTIERVIEAYGLAENGALEVEQ